MTGVSKTLSGSSILSSPVIESLENCVSLGFLRFFLFINLGKVFEWHEGGEKMLCHGIIDLSNQLCTKSDDKAIFVQR